MQICRAGASLLLLIGHAYTYKLCGTELSITYVTTGVEVRVCRVNDSITVDRGNVSLNNLQLQQVNRCTSNMLVRDPEQDLQLCMYQHTCYPTFQLQNICHKQQHHHNHHPKSLYRCMLRKIVRRMKRSIKYINFNI